MNVDLYNITLVEQDGDRFNHVFSCGYVDIENTISVAFSVSQLAKSREGGLIYKVLPVLPHFICLTWLAEYSNALEEMGTNYRKLSIFFKSSTKDNSLEVLGHWGSINPKQNRN
jgi:hypothetical protein